MANERAPRTDLYKVTFKQLALYPNVREDLGEIEQLAKSIEINGVIQPLRGFRSGGLYCVVDGSRRYAAMEIIFNTTGFDTPCEFKIEPKGTQDDQRLLDQFTSNDGKQLTPLEQALGVKKFIEYGWNTKQVSEKLCKSEVYIKRLLTLANAPADFIALIKKRDISATFAMDKIAEGKTQVEDFLATHKDGGFSKYEDQELFEEPENREKKEQKQAKITKKDLEGKGIPNSWSEFKKYADKADYLEMWEQKIYSPVDVFQFLLRLKNNEVVWEDIKDFFMATTEPKEKKVKDDIQDEVKLHKQKGSSMKNSDETVVREYPK